MSDAALDRAVDRAALLLNVNGFVRAGAVLERVPLRAYLDIDPGFGQMWRALDLHDPFAGHDAFVTIGERIGAARTARSRRTASTGSPRRSRSCSRSGRRRPPGDRAPTPVHVRRELARARSRRSSTRASPTACACTSSAASPSCPAPHAGASRGGARHPRGRDRRPRAAALERMAAGRPRAGGGRPVGLPRLRAALEGRADDRQEHVRHEPQRLGQRSQHLLPRQRPAGRGAGHRASRSSTRSGEGLLAFDDLDEAAAALEDGRRRLRPPLRALRARSPRSTSTRTGCSRRLLGRAWDTLAAHDATSGHRPRARGRRRRGVRRLNWGCGELAGARVDQLRHQGRARHRHRRRHPRRACRSRPTASTTPSASTRCPRSPTPTSCPRSTELRRVLKPGGVLRLALPDLDKGIAAYQRGDRDYFQVPDEDARERRREVRHADDLVRLLAQPVHARLHRGAAREGGLHARSTTAAYKQTASRWPEIVELDNRERRASSWRRSNSDGPVLPRLQAVHRRRPQGLGLLQPRALLAERHTALVRFTRRLGVGRDQSLERRARVRRRRRTRTSTSTSLFLSGIDWRGMIPIEERAEYRRPIINLVQHVRHACPNDPLGRHRFLPHKAIRICVSPQIEQGDRRAPAACAARCSRSPMRSTWTRSPRMADAPARDIDVLVAANKQPELGRAVAARLRGEGRTRASSSTTRIPRGELVGLMGRARVTRAGARTRRRASTCRRSRRMAVGHAWSCARTASATARSA